MVFSEPNNMAATKSILLPVTAIASESLESACANQYKTEHFLLWSHMQVTIKIRAVYFKGIYNGGQNDALFHGSSCWDMRLLESFLQLCCAWYRKCSFLFQFASKIWVPFCTRKRRPSFLSKFWCSCQMIATPYMHYMLMYTYSPFLDSRKV